MCSIVLCLEQHPQLPLIVAANRDEWLARPTAPFGQLLAQPQIFGGRDLRAQGTWFAIRPDGTMALVTNHRPGTSPDPKKRSRGQLVLELLGKATLEDMRTAAAAEDPQAYNPFSLLFGRNQEWYSLSSQRPWEDKALPAGVHTLGNLDLDSKDDPKTDFMRKSLVDVAEWPKAQMAEKLGEMLGMPELYLDTESYGTRWSMVYLERAPGDGSLGIAEAGVRNGPLRKVRFA